MALTTRQRRRLDEVRAEIAQIEHRLAVSHGLGDSSSAQGVTTTYSDSLRWTARLETLRRERDSLEAQDAGEALPATPGLLLSRWLA